MTYAKGIGAHSNSTFVYDLTDKDVNYFTSYVGVDRQMYGTVGSVTFAVYVDGGNGNGSDHAVWGDMYNLTTLTCDSRRVRSLDGYSKSLVTLDIAGNEVADFSPLHGLTKLENLIADPQCIEMGSKSR